MSKWSKLTPRTIAELSPKELRSAYSELRRTFNTKLKRIEAAGFQREVSSTTFRPASEFVTNESLAQELAELARYSRQSEYSLREMERRLVGLKHWMEDQGVKRPSREMVTNFARFLEKMRKSDITMDNDQVKYMNMADAALVSFKKRENAQLALQNFDTWSKLTEAGIPDVEDTVRTGELFGMDIRTAIRHRKAIKNYTEELRELSHEGDFKRPQTDQEVENLLQRARRRRHRK